MSIEGFYYHCLVHTFFKGFSLCNLKVYFQVMCLGSVLFKRGCDKVSNCFLLLILCVALFVHLHKDCCLGYLKKQVYRRVNEEMHSVKMVRMETN
jgi:hypothetical protein